MTRDGLGVKRTFYFPENTHCMAYNHLHSVPGHLIPSSSALWGHPHTWHSLTQTSLYIKKKFLRNLLLYAGCGGTYFYSQHLGGSWDSQTYVSSRPAWSTNPGQPGLERNHLKSNIYFFNLVCMNLLPAQVRRECWMLRNWSYRKLGCESPYGCWEWNMDP